MATNNDIPLKVSDNTERVSLRVSDGRSVRSITPDSGSPYYVGARAYVTQIENGATVTCIDKNGTTTATVFNGTDGRDGATGADGFSPSATVSKTGNEATISITDKGGTTIAVVTDGSDASIEAMSNQDIENLLS